jgi:hypothetical protein
MLEVFLDPLRLTLHAAQVPYGGLDQLHFGAHRCQLRHCLFEVGVGHFVKIEFRAAGRLDLPRLYGRFRGS